MFVITCCYTLQAAYCPNHSTETAVISILNRRHWSRPHRRSDATRFICRIWYCWSSNSCRYSKTTVRNCWRCTWLDGKFLSDRSQIVRVGSCESDVITLQFGVPHKDPSSVRRSFWSSARTSGYLKTRIPEGYWNGYPGTRVPVPSTTLSSYFPDAVLV